MTLSYKVMGAGVPDLLVQAAFKDVGDSLTAAGTTQGTALELTNRVNRITTAAANSGVVLASQGSAGDTQSVFNGGANAVKVYPPVGAKINGQATNAAISLAINTGCDFRCVSSTQWFAVLSA